MKRKRRGVLYLSIDETPTEQATTINKKLLDDALAPSCVLFVTRKRTTVVLRNLYRIRQNMPKQKNDSRSHRRDAPYGGDRKSRPDHHQHHHHRRHGKQSQDDPSNEQLHPSDEDEFGRRPSQQHNHHHHHRDSNDNDHHRHHHRHRHTTANDDTEPCPTFDDMKLKADLLKGIYAYGFEKPSAIQQRAIRPIIRGRDVIAQSQSGTGKTAVFSIAGLQVLDETSREMQVLILSPTRELAEQTQRVMQSLGDFMNVRAINRNWGG